MLFRLLGRRSLHTARWISTTSFPQSGAFAPENPTPRVHPPPMGRSLASLPHSSGDGGSTANNPGRLQRLLRLKKIRRLRTAFETFNIPDSRGIVETILSRSTQLGNSKVQSTVMPKLEFLHSLGFQGHLLADIVTSNPRILEVNLNRTVIPFFSFMKEMVPAEFSADDFAAFCATLLKNKFHFTFAPSNFLANVEVFKKHGISNYAILRMVMCDVSVLTVCPRKLDRVVRILKDAGVVESSMTFARGVGIYCSLKAAIVAEKIRLFESLGWSDREIFNLAFKQPQVLRLSCDAIRKKDAFFKEVLHWDASLISQVFLHGGYDIEKRIKARAALLNLLILKGHIGRSVGLWRFCMSEKKFHDLYVERYRNKVVGVVEAYEGRVFEGWEHGCPEKVWVKF